MMELHAAGCSDVGRSRSHNEDSLLIETGVGLFLVADGMGGHGHGDVASQLTVEAIAQYIKEHHPTSETDEDAGNESGNGRLLVSAVRAAHRSVVRAVSEDHNLAGMGTTVVAMLIGPTNAVAAHVGDSRIYRLREGELQLVTDDHTWVNEQVKAGYLSYEQARTHPLKSVVTRAVGGDHDVEVDVRDLALAAGDVFLMCSDGLTTMLEDDRIHQHLTAGVSLEERCRLLVDDANEEGGVDNITVLLIEVTPTGSS